MLQRKYKVKVTLNFPETEVIALDEKGAEYAALDKCLRSTKSFYKISHIPRKVQVKKSSFKRPNKTHPFIEKGKWLRITSCHTKNIWNKSKYLEVGREFRVSSCWRLCRDPDIIGFTVHNHIKGRGVLEGNSNNYDWEIVE